MAGDDLFLSFCLNVDLVLPVPETRRGQDLKQGVAEPDEAVGAGNADVIHIDCEVKAFLFAQGSQARFDPDRRDQVGDAGCGRRPLRDMPLVGGQSGQKTGHIGRATKAHEEFVDPAMGNAREVVLNVERHHDLLADMRGHVGHYGPPLSRAVE